MKKDIIRIRELLAKYVSSSVGKMYEVFQCGRRASKFEPRGRNNLQSIEEWLSKVIFFMREMAIFGCACEGYVIEIRQKP